MNVVRPRNQVSSPRMLLFENEKKVNESGGGVLVRKECPSATSSEACTKCV